MNNRSKNNSIIFLTTLSVYLGLVLVGGAMPSVLAQAATTRNFNVEDEIEIKDDLDKKPDDAKAKKFFEFGFENALIEFIDDLRELNRLGKYQSKSKKSTSIECGHSFCSADRAGASILPSSETWVSDALEKLHGKLDLSRERNFENALSFIEFPITQEEKNLCKEFGLSLQFDKSELKVEIRFSQSSTQKTVAFTTYLNNALAFRATNSNEVLSKLIYENTKAKSESQYVLVVTRLPRGSLDELVRQDVKAVNQ